MTARILIADDHGVVRDGLRLLINAQPDMRVVGTVGSAAEALAFLASPDRDDANPVDCELLILDLAMPGGNAISTIAEVKRLRPELSILVLTMHQQSIHVREALEAGATGYAVKHLGADELLGAMRTVLSGGTYVDPSVAPECPSPVPGLSRREIEVLTFIASGHTNKEAASCLRLSIKTVEGYRSRLFKKLGLQTRAELVRYALNMGLLDEAELEV